MTEDGRTPRVNSMGPLLLRGGFWLTVDETLNLLDRVIDFHLELPLAQGRGRSARVAGDAVVLARRRRVLRSAASCAGRRHRIACSGRDQLLADPTLIAAQIEHRRGVGNAGVRAERIAV